MCCVYRSAMSTRIPIMFIDTVRQEDRCCFISTPAAIGWNGTHTLISSSHMTIGDIHGKTGHRQLHSFLLVFCSITETLCVVCMIEYVWKNTTTKWRCNMFAYANVGVNRRMLCRPVLFVGQSVQVDMCNIYDSCICRRFLLKTMFIEPLR